MPYRKNHAHYKMVWVWNQRKEATWVTAKVWEELMRSGNLNGEERTV